MKHKRYITGTALLVPVLLAFTSPATELSFHPASGESLSKTFRNEQEMSLDEMTMVRNGQEMDMSMFDIESTTTTKSVVSMTDEYGDVADGRPAKLTRTYDEIRYESNVSSNNQMMGAMNFDLTGTSELEGLRVVFTWNADDGEYVASFPEDAPGDEELLEGLTADTDLAGLLPSGEVEEGGAYAIDPNALRALFAPGGDLHLTLESDQESPMGGQSPPPDALIGELEGEVQATFAGMRDEDGVQVAVIELAVDVYTNQDLTDVADEFMDQSGMEEQGIHMELGSVDSEFAFEGEGRLLWNVEAGLLHAIELSGEITQTMDVSMTVEAQGTENDIEQSMTLVGNQTMTVTTERSS